MKTATCSKVIAESSMAQALIRWRLNEVMARHGVRPTELAEEMAVSPTTISNLRKRSMPRLTEETLNRLCHALNKLSLEGTLITPGDLIEYIPDSENPNPKQGKNNIQRQATAKQQMKQGEDSIHDPSSNNNQSTYFVVAVISEIAESA